MNVKRGISLAIFMALVGCATTEFKTYEGRNNLIEGKGGTKVIIDGMELWDNGDPPRRFQLIGIIEDERPGAIIPMMQLRSDMVKKAREVKGDALIQIRSQSQITGYQSTGNTTATSFGNNVNISSSSNSFALKRNNATFAVIKYVD